MQISDRDNPKELCRGCGWRVRVVPSTTRTAQPCHCRGLPRPRVLHEEKQFTLRYQSALRMLRAWKAPKPHCCLVPCMKQCGTAILRVPAKGPPGEGGDRTPRLCSGRCDVLREQQGGNVRQRCTRPLSKAPGTSRGEGEPMASPGGR